MFLRATRNDDAGMTSRALRAAGGRCASDVGELGGHAGKRVGEGQKEGKHRSRDDAMTLGAVAMARHFHQRRSGWADVGDEKGMLAKLII